MAEDEKRASDKLYTHAASKKARGEGAKKAKADEREGEGRKQEAEARTEGNESEGAKIADEGDGTGKVPTAAEAFKEMGARHSKERREAHGNYKTQLDQMHKRHADEIDEAVAKHGTHLEAGPGVTAEEA